MFSVGFLNKNKNKRRNIKQINPLLTSNILKTYGDIKKKNIHKRPPKHIRLPPKPKKVEEKAKEEKEKEKEKEEEEEEEAAKEAELAQKAPEPGSVSQLASLKTPPHSPKHNENKYFENMYTSMEGYSLGKTIDDELLFSINKNISDFVNSLLVNKIKNILLVCSDYPGYGGAATNCKKIADFLIKLNFNVYTVYWLWDNEPNKKYSSDNFHIVVDRRYLPNIFNTIINGVNKPDVVILKSALDGFDLRSYFGVPVYFLIPGLFRNQLNKYYLSLGKRERKRFLNRQVITQIKNSSFSFANSQHVKSYLNELEIKVGIFHSTFIDRYRQKIVQDPLFKNRKYKYGLVVSDFNRTIKNVDKSIDYLKDYSNNTILIGKNSNKYSQLGFTCVDLVPPENMVSYYKEIKYIVQDSHFEACSNVLVEACFNGCKIKKSEPKIIISSTQYPGYGGAATNAYNLIKYLRNNGYKVAGVFFHNNININYDPDNIGGIFICKYNPRLNTLSNPDYYILKYKCIRYLNGYPTICLAKNYVAPILCKEIFDIYCIYLVSGINHQSIYYPSLSFEQIMKLNNVKPINKEIYCLKKVDNVVFNSNLCKMFFEKFYSQYKSKFHNTIIDTTNIIPKTKFPTNCEKIYDIVICCSILTRSVKNNLFLVNVLKDKSFDKYTKFIIGEKYESFKELPNSTCVGLLNNKKVLEIFSKSKILLFPSLIDANPNTVREAYYSKCIPIITKNIGKHDLFPNESKCNSFDVGEWRNKINYNIENYENYKFDVTIFDGDTFDTFCNDMLDI